MWTIGGDIRFGIRVLRNNPGFTAVAVFTLALGIAANTTVFSWVDGLLLRPYPGSSDSERLAVFEMLTNAPNGGTQISYLDYLDYRKQMKSLAGLAVHREDVFSLGQAGSLQPVWGELVSGNYFAVLGLRPQLGRVFTAEEDGNKLGAYPVAVISDALWRGRFHADRSAVGKTVRVNRRELTVVGVAPPEFRGTQPGLAFDIWVPVTMGPILGMTNTSMFQYRTARMLYGLARLGPGVTIGQAAAEAMSVASNLAALSPKTNRGLSATVLPPWRFHSAAPDLLLNPLRILMAFSGLVLLIVCANVANLLLARSVTRQREFGVRLALGAGRLQLARQVMIEAFMLTGLGALVGIPLTMWMADSLPALVPQVGIKVLFGYHMNGRIMAFTILSCSLAALLSAAVPALFSARCDVNEALREGGRSGASSARSHRTRGLFVIAEVALASVALIGAGLFVRSFENARSMYPGFDKRNVTLARFYLSNAGYTQEDALHFCLNLRDRLLNEPAVAEAAYADFVPLGSTAGPWDEIEAQGYVPAVGEPMTANRAAIAPGYFSLMRIPLLEGRDFRDSDDAKAPPVSIVSEAFARRYFGGASPVGRKVRSNRIWTTVIGMARDSKYFSVAETPRPFLYVAFRQRYSTESNVYFLIRTGVGLTPVADGNSVVGSNRSTAPDATMQVTAALRRVATSIDPNAADFYPMPLSSWTGITMLPQKMAASILAALGLISLTLAAIGLYSVMAYAVTQRTQEIGVRMALGAMPSQVLRDVLRRGMSLTILGLIAGLVGALAAARLVSNMLVDVNAFDPLAFAGAALFLCLVAIAAIWLPARRATKVDPIVALRFE